MPPDCGIDPKIRVDETEEYKTPLLIDDRGSKPEGLRNQTIDRPPLTLLAHIPDAEQSEDRHTDITNRIELFQEFRIDQRC